MLALEALKVECPLEKVPELSDYDWDPFPPNALGIYGRVYHRNASLALQLCRYFYNYYYKKDELKKSIFCARDIPTAQAFKMDLTEAVGLNLCRWPGRGQMISKTLANGVDLKYFLDGAHTKLSMLNCVEWFSTISSQIRGDLGRDKVLRVLVFNLTRNDRKPEPLLKLLTGCDFDAIFFTPHADKCSGDMIDNICSNPDMERNRCGEFAEVWAGMSGAPTKEVETFKEAIEAIHETALKQKVLQVQVLITGSIKLLSKAFLVIKPSQTFKPSPEVQRQVLEEYKKMLVQ